MATNDHAEYFSPEAVAEAAHVLWFCRLHSKSRLWRVIAPAVRAGLNDVAVVRNAYFQLHRLESLAHEIIERWPHLEPEVTRRLERAARR